MWPLREAPTLEAKGGFITQQRVDASIKDWLRKAMDRYLPDAVRMVLFTPLTPEDSRLKPQVPAIVRPAKTLPVIAGRFAWAVRYNMGGKGHSLFQVLHRGLEHMGRSVVVLSTRTQPAEWKLDPQTSGAWIKFPESKHDLPTPYDSIVAADATEVSLQAIFQEAIHMDMPEIAFPKAEYSSLHTSSAENDEFDELLKRQIIADGSDYRRHVWPLLQKVSVFLVMSPPFKMARDDRQHVGACGLTFLVSKDSQLDEDLVERLLTMTRVMDSLFGVAYNLYQRQAREETTHKALNAIAHSLGNRFDRLTVAHPACAKELYLQKLVFYGAASHARATAECIQGRTGPLLWCKAGAGQTESLSTTLTEALWANRCNLSLDCSQIENQFIDVRLVTVLEELAVNLEKWNPEDFPAKIRLVCCDRKSEWLSVIVEGLAYPNEIVRIRDDIGNLCDSPDQIAIRGLRAILMMLVSLRTPDSAVLYEFGEPAMTSAPQETLNVFQGLPVRIRLHASATINNADSGPFPMRFSAINLRAILPGSHNL